MDLVFFIESSCTRVLKIIEAYFSAVRSFIDMVLDNFDLNSLIVKWDWDVANDRKDFSVLLIILSSFCVMFSSETEGSKITLYCIAKVKFLSMGSLRISSPRLARKNLNCLYEIVLKFFFQ